MAYDPYSVQRRRQQQQPGVPGTPPVAPPPPRPPQVQRPGAAPAAPNFQQAATVAPPARRQAYQPQTQQRTSGLGQQMQTFASGGLATPNRYDSPLVKQSMDLIAQRTERNRQDAQRGIRENMASRGVFGDSPHDVALTELEERLSLAEGERSNALAREIAAVEAADRSAAMGSANVAGSFGRGLDQDIQSEGRFGYESGVASDRDYEDATRARAGLQLQGQGMANEDFLNRYQLQMALEGQTFGQGMQAAGFEEDANRYRTELGERQYEFGRGQGLQEDLGYGSLGLEGGRLGLQAELGRGSLGLEGERLEQQSQQFGQSLEEQRAGRVGSQGLQERALQLQATGMSLDQAYRQAQMEQQGQQFGASLGEQRRQFDTSTGFTQQELQQRATQIQQQESQFGRSLSNEQAQAEAQRQLSREQMQQQGGQFEQQLAQQGEQFYAGQVQDLVQQGMLPISGDHQVPAGWQAIQIGDNRFAFDPNNTDLAQRAQQLSLQTELGRGGLTLEQQRLQQQGQQFGQGLEEQRAGRLQQGGQFQQGLQQQSNQFDNQSAQRMVELGAKSISDWGQVPQGYERIELQNADGSTSKWAVPAAQLPGAIALRDVQARERLAQNEQLAETLRLLGAFMPWLPNPGTPDKKKEEVVTKKKEEVIDKKKEEVIDKDGDGDVDDEDEILTGGEEFPLDPSDGQTWRDPKTGIEWVYSNGSWQQYNAAPEFQQSTVSLKGPFDWGSLQNDLRGAGIQHDLNSTGDTQYALNYAGDQTRLNEILRRYNLAQ